MSKLTMHLRTQKGQFLEARAERGGTAEQFRTYVRQAYFDEPVRYDSFVVEALMEAATRTWQEMPRKRGPDLFSISNVAIPETLTRRRASVDGMAADDDEDFEKVSSQYATVNDLYEDATIKMRKAAQSSAAAESEMVAADEARKRAGGKMDARLKDLADAETVSPPLQPVA